MVPHENIYSLTVFIIHSVEKTYEEPVSRILVYLYLFLTDVGTQNVDLPGFFQQTNREVEHSWRRSTMIVRSKSSLAVQIVDKILLSNEEHPGSLVHI